MFALVHLHFIQLGKRVKRKDAGMAKCVNVFGRFCIEACILRMHLSILSSSRIAGKSAPATAGARSRRRGPTHSSRPSVGLTDAWRSVTQKTPPYAWSASIAICVTVRSVGVHSHGDLSTPRNAVACD